MSKSGQVLSVARSSKHTFSKRPDMFIHLREGQGVEGDAHSGAKVKHIYHAAKDPEAPNLRQVHLVHTELFEALKADGFEINPGDIGENILTRGIDLLALPECTRLHIGDTAVVEVTGLRSPCKQLNTFQPGLMQAVLDKDTDGNLIRKSGIMGIVISGGQVSAGDVVSVNLPDGPHRKLGPV